MTRLHPMLTIALVLVLAAGCDSDTTPPADGASPDTIAIDAGPPDTRGPLANVYKINPVEDKKSTSQVLLRHITDKQGKLTGAFADVWNCLNKDGGEKIDVGMGGMKITGKMCLQQQTATPGTDGTYLQVKPPAKDGDGDDPFAEVMMYHHINEIHDHYYQDFGLKHLASKQMRAIVNVQAYIDLAFGWVGMLNAAYVPKESGSIFKTYFGIDLNKGKDVIIFSQDTMTSTVDTSYDAPVIYHEYTHATIGSGALWMPATDTYGVDPTPKALNEALADYFPCSHVDRAKIGTYALAAAGAARDLTRSFKCPDHIVGEEHHDGEIASGALWAMRKVLGRDVADQAIWDAVVTFTMTTNYEQASKAILAEIQKVAPTKHDAVKKIFEARGMLGCVRLLPHADVKAGGLSAPRYPAAMKTTFGDSTPGYMQYRLKLDSTTKQVTIAYTAQVGQSFMGFGGGKGDVAIALSPGSAPITYDYSSGKAVSTAHAELKGTAAGNGHKLVLSGDCIVGGQELVYQFVNKGTDGGTITKLAVTQSPTVTNPTDNFTGCATP